MMKEDAEKTLPPVKYTPVYIQGSHNIPKGAVGLAPHEIIKLQQKRIKRCKSDSDKSAFTWAPYLLGASAAVTGLLVNAHFRWKFHLFNYGLLYSYLPVVLMPVIMTVQSDEQLTHRVLLKPECNECLEVRSGLRQVVTSILYSTMLSPLICIILSRKYHTYLIKNNFQPTVKHALKTTSSTKLMFLGLLVQNFAAGAFVRHKQGKQLEHIMAEEPQEVSRELLEQLKD